MTMVRSLAARMFGVAFAGLVVLAVAGAVLAATAHGRDGSTSWATVALVLGPALVLAAVAAYVQVRAVLTRLRALAAALEAAAAGDVRTEITVGRPDEIGAVAVAAGAVVTRLQHSLVTVARSAAALDTGWRAVLDISNQMSDTAESTAAMATAAAASAEQVSVNVQVVAAATEQLGATIREVAIHAAEASSVAREASDQALHANATVATLGEASQRVEQVVELIQTIAGQTHLLALNATIEAARAGEAGRGFTVVADEVKSLAGETSRATGRVTQSVQEIQLGSSQAGVVINEITVTIERVSENQSAIAAAVEEQTVATHEIGRGAAEAAVGSAAIASNVAKLATGAQATAYAGAQCRTNAAEIAEVTAELERLIEGVDLAGLLELAAQDKPAAATATVVDGVTIIENTVAGEGLHEFDFRGSWSHSLTNATADGTNSYSSLTGDVVRLRFLGTRLTFFGVTDANHGLAAVSVDGGPETLVDEYSAARATGVNLWRSPVLPYGEHVFELRVAGRKNDASRYVWATVDRVEIV